RPARARRRRHPILHPHASRLRPGKITAIELNATLPVDSVPTRFTRVAAQFGECVAVSTPAADWTYAELHRRSDFIAAEILSCTSRSSEPVALLMDHGAPLIAVILGVLKA